MLKGHLQMRIEVNARFSFVLCFPWFCHVYFMWNECPFSCFTKIYCFWNTVGRNKEECWQKAEILWITHMKVRMLNYWRHRKHFARLIRFWEPPLKDTSYTEEPFSYAKWIYHAVFSVFTPYHIIPLYFIITILLN